MADAITTDISIPRGMLGILAGAALCVTPGCASILSGGNQELTFQSEPPGATVSVGGKEIGKTPVSARVKREDKQVVLVEMDGYSPYKTELVTKTNSLVWLNAIFLTYGPLSSTTDANTGAIREYAQSKYMITLIPKNAGPLRIEDDKARKVKDFVFAGYPNIQTDVAKGSGDYLNSLFNLLDVPADRKKESLEKVRALSTLYKDIPTFADKLLDQFMAVKQTTSTETR